MVFVTTVFATTSRLPTWNATTHMSTQMSYHAFLRSLPPGKGVQMEFARLSYYLWGMARQHRRFKNAHMPADTYLEVC